MFEQNKTYGQDSSKVLAYLTTNCWTLKMQWAIYYSDHATFLSTEPAYRCSCNNNFSSEIFKSFLAKFSKTPQNVLINWVLVSLVSTHSNGLDVCQLLFYIYNKFNIIIFYALSSVANRTCARNTNNNKILMIIRSGNYQLFKTLSLIYDIAINSILWLLLPVLDRKINDNRKKLFRY